MPQTKKILSSGVSFCSSLRYFWGNEWRAQNHRLSKLTFSVYQSQISSFDRFPGVFYFRFWKFQVKKLQYGARTFSDCWTGLSVGLDCISLLQGQNEGGALSHIEESPRAAKENMWRRYYLRWSNWCFVVISCPNRPDADRISTYCASSSSLMQLWQIC